MDDVDIAQARFERDQEQIRKDIESRRSHADSLEHCDECGAEIPQARRDAVPGCRYCIECQQWHDRRLQGSLVA